MILLVFVWLGAKHVHQVGWCCRFTAQHDAAAAAAALGRRNRNLPEHSSMGHSDIKQRSVVAEPSTGLQAPRDTAHPTSVSTNNNISHRSFDSVLSKLRFPSMRKQGSKDAASDNTPAEEPFVRNAMQPYEQQLSRQQCPQGWWAGMWNNTRPAVNSMQLNRMHAQHVMQVQHAAQYVVAANPTYLEIERDSASDACMPPKADSHTAYHSRGISGVFSRVMWPTNREHAATTASGNIEARRLSTGFQNPFIPRAPLEPRPQGSRDILQSTSAPNTQSSVSGAVLSPGELSSLMRRQAPAVASGNAAGAGNPNSQALRIKAFENSFADRSPDLPPPEATHPEATSRAVQNWLESIPTVPECSGRLSRKEDTVPLSQNLPFSIGGSPPPSPPAQPPVHLRVSTGATGSSTTARFTAAYPPPPLSQRDAPEEVTVATNLEEQGAVQQPPACESQSNDLHLQFHTPPQSFIHVDIGAPSLQQQPLVATELSQTAVNPRSHLESFHALRQPGKNGEESCSIKLTDAGGTAPRGQNRYKTGSGTISVFRAGNTGNTGFESASSTMPL